jgi:hypothetical protein
MKTRRFNSIKRNVRRRPSSLDEARDLAEHPFISERFTSDMRPAQWARLSKLARSPGMIYWFGLFLGLIGFSGAFLFQGFTQGFSLYVVLELAVLAILWGLAVRAVVMKITR